MGAKNFHENFYSVKKETEFGLLSYRISKLSLEIFSLPNNFTLYRKSPRFLYLYKGPKPVSTDWVDVKYWEEEKNLK